MLNQPQQEITVEGRTLKVSGAVGIRLESVVMTLLLIYNNFPVNTSPHSVHLKK